MTRNDLSQRVGAVDAVEGNVMPFDEYLARVQRPKPTPVIWPWASLLKTLSGAQHGARGTLALETPGASAATVVPGLSIAVQAVQAGERTESHSHSFWHLFIVQEGSGEAGFGEGEARQKLSPGDLLLVPAWQAHWFRADEENLLMLVIQNLPQNAEAGSFAIEKEDGSVGVLYSSD